MTYILTICIGFSNIWSTCSQIRKIETPTLAECNAERDALMRFKTVSYVTCEAKPLEKKQ